MATIKALLDEIGTTLAQITVLNGYQTNVGSKVVYWQDLPFDYGEVGAVTYRDPEVSSTLVNRQSQNEVRIEIEAIATTANPKATSCAIIEDIYKAVRGDETWNGLSIWTRPTETESILKDIETQGKTAVRVQCNFVICLRSNRFEV